MKFLILALLAPLCASAATVTLDKKTPVIVPSEQIQKMRTVEWDKVEKAMKAGKSFEDNAVMQCDDHFASIVEIRINDGIDKDVSIDTDGCKFMGAQFSDDSDSFLHFDGPNGGGCVIKVKKARKNQSPLLATFDISEAC